MATEMAEEKITGFVNYVFRYGTLRNLNQILHEVKPHDFVMVAENENYVGVASLIMLDGFPRKPDIENLARKLLKSIHLNQGTVAYCTFMNFSINSREDIQKYNKVYNMKYSENLVI